MINYRRSFRTYIYISIKKVHRIRRKEQKKLVEQLMSSVSGPTTTSGTTVGSAGPPTRRLLAHCLTTLFRDLGDSGTRPLILA